ncbi:hypothetical protein RFI_17726, partial [Reticulomyxa filosa]
MSSLETNDEVTLTIIVEASIENGEDKCTGIKVSKNTAIEILKPLIEIECGVVVNEYQLLYHNKELRDTDTLATLGIKSDDAIILRLKKSTTSHIGSSGSVPAHNDNNALNLGMPIFGPNAELPTMPGWLNMNADTLQQALRADSAMMNQLLHQNPSLAQAVLAEDTTMLQQYMNKQRAQFQQQLLREQQRRMALEADPLNPDSQKLIATEIEESNIHQNYEMAVEEMPEAFGRVVMLYVPMEVEGIRLNAFIDSGAQTTIMSAKTAEKCGY